MFIIEGVYSGIVGMGVKAPVSSSSSLILWFPLEYSFSFDLRTKSNVIKIEITRTIQNNTENVE